MQTQALREVKSIFASKAVVLGDGRAAQMYSRRYPVHHRTALQGDGRLLLLSWSSIRFCAVCEPNTRSNKSAFLAMMF